MTVPAARSPITSGRLRGARHAMTTPRSVLITRLAACGVRSAADKPDPPGFWGSATQAGIRTVLSCPGFESVPSSSLAHEGALTSTVWCVLMNGAEEPSLDARIETIIHSFEATDFGDPPEWNFCQDSSISERAQAQLKRAPIRCYNATDPCSMLTWGPRGATAGQGREINYGRTSYHLK